ncbi:MAG: hypothetical protein KDJ15_06345, partial [Alphaproteobacteria bacterium]|nr:hypothetical protein [Alphaproteobacteria bacterium]
RALAMAEMNADYNTFLLGRRALDRQTEKAHGVASVGTAEDIDDRLIQFRKRYCDPNDNAGLLEKVCAEDIDSATMNKDIDFGRTIGTPWTLALDFSDSEKTGDEQDVLALSSNLFGHSVFENIPDAYFENPQNAYKILDMRSLIAKRSVAQYSFDALTGMKAEGPAEMDKTGGYMKAVLDQLGIPESDIPTLLSGGEATQNGTDTDALLKPSYYAQMEVLTKKIYQNPSFYMTLYDTPANIDRKGAALRAISLMQNTDMLKSRLRSEMLLSVLLETELDPLYKEAQGALDRMRPKGEPDK